MKDSIQVSGNVGDMVGFPAAVGGLFVLLLVLSALLG